MDLIQAILYGIVQGITEWLPISSTAHLRVLPALAGWQDPGAGFTAVIQLGTLLAVLIYFRTELWGAIKGWVGSFRGGEAAKTPEARLGWAVFVGTFPIVICGVLFEDQIKGGLRSLWVIATMLIVVGVFMIVAERLGKQTRELKDVSWRDGLWVGLWQAVALIPGSSRSGSTMTGAFIAGFDKSTAARFSFLLSVPSIFAAGIKELYDERAAILGAQLLPTIVATIVSFFVGYASIAWLIGYLRRGSTLGFVIYRFLLAGLLIFLMQTGRLDPMVGIETPSKTDVSTTTR